MALLTFEKFLALALVVAESFMFLSAKECGFVVVLLVSWFVFAHHRSFRSIGHWERTSPSLF